MKRIAFRIAIERPSVGFDYHGFWYLHDPTDALKDAQRELQKDPHTPVRLQLGDGMGNTFELGWKADWLSLLDTRLASGMPNSQWSRMLADVVLANTPHAV